MPNHMSKPMAKCIGAECEGCSSPNCYAEGGKIGSGKQRYDFEKGVHKTEDEPQGSDKRQWERKSAAGRAIDEADHPSLRTYNTSSENRFNKEKESEAKEMNERVLGQISMLKNKDRSGMGMAGGGKVGSGSRFKHLESELSHEKGIHDPAALAASIGRKKYGAKAMGEMSHHEYAEGGCVGPECPGCESGSCMSKGDMEGDSELHDLLGDELLDAFERKDRKGIMDGLEALIMSCMSKGDAS